MMPSGRGSRRYRAVTFNVGALSWWHLYLGHAIRYIRAKRECELRDIRRVARGSRRSAYGYAIHARLPLTSELDALCAAWANSAPTRYALGAE